MQIFDYIQAHQNYFFIAAIILVVFILLLLLSKTKYELRYLGYALNEKDDALQQEKLLNKEYEEEVRWHENEKNNLERQLIALNKELELFQQYTKDKEKQFETFKQALNQEFKYLSQQILEEKGSDLIQHNHRSLNHLLIPFKEKIESFEKRVNEVHTQSIHNQSALSEQVKQVLSMGIQMSDEAKTLSRALKGDKKALGNWGEMQLELALERAGLIKNKHYKSQVSFKTEHGQILYPDMVIYLPDNKQLIIDSKASLNAYQSAVSATDQKDQTIAFNEFIKATKEHIKDLEKKNYTRLPGIDSPGFVLMFMPIEAAFIELLQQQENLYQFAYERHVVLCSPNTLIPLLKTIAMLWMMQDSNEKAVELGGKASDIYNQIAIISEHLSKLGQTLATTSRHYNATVRSFAGTRGLVSKVEGFQNLSAKTSKRLTETPEIESSFDIDRIQEFSNRLEKP